MEALESGAVRVGSSTPTTSKSTPRISRWSPAPTFSLRARSLPITTTWLPSSSAVSSLP